MTLNCLGFGMLTVGTASLYFIGRVQHTFRIKCCLKYMKLLRILCKGEDFYELCKHNYYPKTNKKTYKCLLSHCYHYDNTAHKGLQCNLIFKNETDAFKKYPCPPSGGSQKFPSVAGSKRETSPRGNGLVLRISYDQLIQVTKANEMFCSQRIDRDKL